MPMDRWALPLVQMVSETGARRILRLTADRAPAAARSPRSNGIGSGMVRQPGASRAKRPDLVDACAVMAPNSSAAGIHRLARAETYLASMSEYGRSDTRRAGMLRLSVWHLDDVAREVDGFRRRYGYTVESSDSGATHEGDDLWSGVGAPIDTAKAMRTLVSFLSTAGDAHQYAMVHPDSEPENLDLFPAWVAEAAYLNADELAMLLLEDDAFAESASDVDESARFISVVFQQGGDADEALAILDQRGPAAAIEHLAQWDNGQETDDAADVYWHVYDEVPIGERDAIAVSGDYVMTYNVRLGYVGLVRKIDPPSDPAADRGAEHGRDRSHADRAVARSNRQSPWIRHEHRPGGPAHPLHSF